MSSDFDDFDDDYPSDNEIELDLDLTPEQQEKLVEDLQEFTNSFLSHLANTSNYELVPTQTEDGIILKEEHYRLIKKECEKLGASILYTYKVGNNMIIINPKNLKSAIIMEEVIH